MLEAEGLATKAELAAYAPGGAENNESPRGAWIYFYAQLVRMNGRLEWHQKVQSPFDAAQRQREKMAGLRSTPETVELIDLDEEGNPRTLQVFPKSIVATEEVTWRAFWLAMCLDSWHELTALPDPEAPATEQRTRDLELAVRVLDEISYQRRVIAWVATTPGVGLPYEEGARAPEIPKTLGDLSGVDFLTIAAAYQRVNAKRLQALEVLMDNTTAPDFSVYFTRESKELGIPPHRLARDVAAVELIMSSAERARGEREAMDAAKRKSKGPALELV